MKCSISELNVLRSGLPLFRRRIEGEASKACHMKKIFLLTSIDRRYQSFFANSFAEI